MKRETVIVLDFGGQYNQLIARRVRECNVYCEIYSYKTDIEKIKEIQPKGIIFTGGPNSAYLPDSPTYTKEIFELGIPILGICYGSQLMMHLLGGKVEVAPVREYGKIEVTVDTSSALFENVSEKTICWMSHTDYIARVPAGFRVTASTPHCPCAAMENAAANLLMIAACCACVGIVIGVVTMKMMSRTSMTSTNGVTLISDTNPLLPPTEDPMRHLYSACPLLDTARWAFSSRWTRLRNMPAKLTRRVSSTPRLPWNVL